MQKRHLTITTAQLHSMKRCQKSNPSWPHICFIQSCNKQSVTSTSFLYKKNSPCKWTKNPVSRLLLWNPMKADSGGIRFGKLRPDPVLQMVLISDLWPFILWPEQNRRRSRAGSSWLKRRGTRCVRPPSRSWAPAQTCCRRCYCPHCRCSQSPNPAWGTGGGHRKQITENLHLGHQPFSIRSIRNAKNSNQCTHSNTTTIQNGAKGSETQTGWGRPNIVAIDVFMDLTLQKAAVEYHNVSSHRIHKSEDI